MLCFYLYFSPNSLQNLYSTKPNCRIEAALWLVNTVWKLQFDLSIYYPFSASSSTLFSIANEIVEDLYLTENFNSAGYSILQS